MDRDRVIHRLCILATRMAEAMEWEHPADCFCGSNTENFQFSEKVMAELEEAVNNHILVKLEQKE